jgi:hypothetical protein
MVGGAGDDIYFVDHAGDAIAENASEGNDVVHATIDYTIGANIESLILDGITVNGARQRVQPGSIATNQCRIRSGIDNHDEPVVLQDNVPMHARGDLFALLIRTSRRPVVVEWLPSRQNLVGSGFVPSPAAYALPPVPRSYRDGVRVVTSHP